MQNAAAAEIDTDQRGSPAAASVRGFWSTFAGCGLLGCRGPCLTDSVGTRIRRTPIESVHSIALLDASQKGRRTP